MPESVNRLEPAEDRDPTEELSIVPAGAQHQTFLLAKEAEMPDPIVLDAEEILKTITEGKLEDADELLELLGKDKTLSAEEKQSIAAAVKLMQGAGKNIPKAIQASLKRLLPFGEEEEEKKKAKKGKGGHTFPTEEEEEKAKAKAKAEATKKAAEAKVVTMPVRKEDGTLDLTGVPAEQRPFFEALAKENADAKTKADDLAKELKVERDARELRDFEARVTKEFPNLPGKTEEKAAMLKEAYSVSKDFGDRLAAGWKAQEAALEKANTALLSTVGHGAYMSKGSDAEQRLEAMAKELVEKSAGKLDFYQAYAQVLEQNQETYALHKAEKGVN